VIQSLQEWRVWRVSPAAEQQPNRARIAEEARKEKRRDR
jgi:hypothetical protein